MRENKNLSIAHVGRANEGLTKREFAAIQIGASMSAKLDVMRMTSFDPIAIAARAVELADKIFDKLEEEKSHGQGQYSNEDKLGGSDGYNYARSEKRKAAIKNEAREGCP